MAGSAPVLVMEVAAPTWMASLDSATPGKALVLGALLSGANPKNFVLAAASRHIHG